MGQGEPLKRLAGYFEVRDVPMVDVIGAVHEVLEEHERRISALEGETDGSQGSTDDLPSKG